MKLQYKSAGLMMLIGLVILGFLTTFYSIQNRSVVLQKELQNIKNSSEEIAWHMDSHLKEMAAVATTLSSAPIIRDVLLKSNSQFKTLSVSTRVAEINKLNRQWKNAKDIGDPFIQKHLTNPVAEFLKLQQIIMPGLYGEIFLTNRYGVMVASSGKLTTLAHAHKYWWKSSYNEGKGKVFFDDRGFDASVEGYVLGVVIPIRVGPEIIGILKCNINIKGRLTDIVQKHKLQNFIKIQVVRTKGLIIAEKEKVPLSSSLNSDLIALLKIKNADVGFLNESGRKELFAFSPINLTMGTENFGFGGSYKSTDHKKGNKGEGWHIVVSEAESIAIKDADETTRLLIIVGVIFTIVTSFFALYFGRWIANPLVKLADSAQKIGKGQLDTRISVVNKDEIGILAESINNMAGNLQETLISRDSLITEIKLRKVAEEDLKESEEKLHLIIDRSSIGICTVDLLGNFIMTNPAYEIILGYSKEELKELSFYEVTHPDNRPENKKLFQNMFNLKTKDFTLEKKYIRKDGTEIDVVVHSVGIRDDEGNVKFGTAFVEDITERKQAEEQIKASLKEKNTLIDEIHHRVKNNLNVITSLLNLQAKRIDDDRTKDILKDSQSRIYAMAAIHETLHGSENLSEIDLKKYLFKITTSIFQASSIDPKKVKLRTDIEELPISIDQASPLGLIINELLSNSLKYAFPDEGEGEIIVSMKKLDKELELTIEDDGIGLPEEFDLKNSKTLGLKLVRTLVENQLDGSIDMESNNGTKFTIKFNIET